MGMLSNLTCNPGIIYDLFINNLRQTWEQVQEQRRGYDGDWQDSGTRMRYQRELNDPWESDAQILEEAAKFKEMLSEYRVVIKVPHTGPVNKDNVKNF